MWWWRLAKAIQKSVANNIETNETAWFGVCRFRPAALIQIEFIWELVFARLAYLIVRNIRASQSNGCGAESKADSITGVRIRLVETSQSEFVFESFERNQIFASVGICQLEFIFCSNSV